ncbi:MAG: hypothetical protein IPQ13_07085 [Holophagaceae bacterium]|nr:hypothetical protein [Holophagaceae bacterium]
MTRLIRLTGLLPLAPAILSMANLPAAQAAPPLDTRVVRAQYSWGYLGPDGEGKGTLAVLVDAATGRVVLELHGLGERLMLLEGDRAKGYRVQIPRQKLDEQAPGLGGLPLPFLPRLGTPEALRALITDGTGEGVKVTKKDAKGPVKLKYQGKDDFGKDVQVWLVRTRLDVSD